MKSANIATTGTIKTLKQAYVIGGKVQKGNSKILGSTFNLPTSECNTGVKLKQIAGSVCSDCYAVKIEKGIHGKTVLASEQKNFKAWQNIVDSGNYELWINAITMQILNESKLKLKNKLQGAKLHRWFSSGDLQGYTMLLCIVQIAKMTPIIKHWLPTKEKALISRYIRENGNFPSNLNVRVSDAMIDGKQGKIETGFTRSSVQGRKTANHDSNLIGNRCPVAFNKNIKSCGDCDKCWDSKVDYIIYKQH